MIHLLSENQTIIRNSDISILETSLADIDSDGLDELIFNNENGTLVVKNSNETNVNGFPVECNFYGTPIIANIIDITELHLKLFIAARSKDRVTTKYNSKVDSFCPTISITTLNKDIQNIKRFFNFLLLIFCQFLII